jgi:hypothetical protein
MPPGICVNGRVFSHIVVVEYAVGISISDLIIEKKSIKKQVFDWFGA